MSWEIQPIYILCSIIFTLTLWAAYRERKLYRLSVRYEALVEHYRLAQDELSLCRQEKEYLREANAHVQGLLKDNAALLIASRKEMDHQFQSLCSQALVSTQQSFLSLLEPVLSQFQQSSHSQLKEQSTFLHTLIAPLEKSLQDLSQHIHGLEQARVGAYEGLKEQILHLSQGQKALHAETNTLITALRAPHIRGCWGEMQLRRVVELAGMSSYCDFQEQPTLEGDKKLKPDMIIRLPGNKHIIVDAKAPLLHYLEATSAKTTEEHAHKMKEHSRLLMTHIKALSDKKYWAHQLNSVEFTLLFLPGESFLSAALESNPALMEYAADRQIVLATPVILIALLKTIAQGWRQETLSQHTRLIISLSKDLCTRLEAFQGHMKSVGKALKQGLNLYQEAEASLENHILPSAHRLSHLPQHSEPVDESIELELANKAI